MTVLGASLASWSVQFSGCESLSARLELSSLCLSPPLSEIYFCYSFCIPVLIARHTFQVLELYAITRNISD